MDLTKEKNTQGNTNQTTLHTVRVPIDFTLSAFYYLDLNTSEQYLSAECSSSSRFQAHEAA